MRLLTLRTDDGSRAVRQDGETLTEIDGFGDVGQLLKDPAWIDIAQGADGARHDLASADLAAVVPTPGKIICVGLNYRTHILAMGRDLPKFPTLFSKFAEMLIGANDDIALQGEDEAVDW